MAHVQLVTLSTSMCQRWNSFVFMLKHGCFFDQRAQLVYQLRQCFFGVGQLVPAECLVQEQTQRIFVQEDLVVEVRVDQRFQKSGLGPETVVCLDVGTERQFRFLGHIYRGHLGCGGCGGSEYFS